MPWEVKVVSESKVKTPIEILRWEAIIDRDKYTTWAIESLTRACKAKNEGKESNDRSRAKETIRRLKLCGVEVELVEVPAPEGE